MFILVNFMAVYKCCDRIGFADTMQESEEDYNRKIVKIKTNALLT
ncbi:hypothetical protein [Neobacillus cucumis]|nr:hypothetical protein [Neobacillus cucumis]